MKKLALAPIPFIALCALTAAAQAAESAADESILSGIGGVKFIAGQFFTILASVVGVYFASYVSFQRSLKHRRLVQAQQTAALLTATRQELTDNIVRLRKFNERLPAESGYGLSSSEWPRLRLFVWQAAGRSSSAFDLPPQILNGVQGLYDDLGDMLQDSAAHENFKRLTSSNIYDRTQYKERLNALLSDTEATILPLLDKTVAEAQQTVAKLSG